MTSELQGILPIWKPAGYTSHDVVAKARRILRIKRIGHTGTLDPAVTGVLPLCIGRATRLVEYIQELPKEYEAVLRLGMATNTEDLSGEVLSQEEGLAAKLTPEAVTEAILRFQGEIEQIPPMYSAVKVDGKRLYELARQGVEVERKVRRITVHEIEVLNTDWSGVFPEVSFRVRCSKGTYIRTLCVDIGRAIGVPAVMASLVRTSTGPYTQANCLTLEQVEELQREGRLQERLLPIESAVGHLPAVQLNAEQARRALQGQKIALPPGRVPQEAGPGPVTLAVSAEDHGLVGIYEWDEEQSYLRPVKIFS